MTPPKNYEVETFSGFFVDTSDPKPATIHLVDIAHALSQTCRYGGHCQRFYSVAEHAVFVSQRVKRKGGSIAAQMAALHHDDAEAYLGDIPRPLKPLLGEAYEDLTNKMDCAIMVALQLPSFTLYKRAIKEADNWSLFVEAKYLLPSQGKGWWNGEQGAYKWDLQPDLPSRIVTPDYWRGGLVPRKAKKLYLTRHNQLLERATT
jgi:hypothetical protein